MLAALKIQLLLASLALGDVGEKLRVGLLPSSSQYTGLEAPLEVAAASPIVKTVRSHQHGDEDNLERLCKDPFHSFLCKPLNPRRSRINGKLRPGAVIPPGIIPEASNLQESSQPLESSSDLFRRSKSYLPPLRAKAPQKHTEPQYQPPDLPKVTKHSTIRVTSNNPSQIKISSQLITNNQKQSVKTPTKPIKLPTTNDKKVEVQPESSNQNLQQQPLNKVSRKYLPIDELNVSPDSTNLSPSIENISPVGLRAQNRKGKDEAHSLERLCNDPFHSFLCKPRKQRKRFDGQLRPGAKIPANVVIGASSNRREARVLPRDAGSVSSDYLPPNPSANNNGYYYQKPSNPVSTSGSSSQDTTKKPLSNQYLAPSNVQQGTAGGGDSGYNYPKPTSGSQTTAQGTEATVTLPSITTQRPGTTDNQDSTQQQGYTYERPPGTPISPSPSNIQSNAVAGGYVYEKPSNPLDIPSITNSPTTSLTLTTNSATTLNSQPSNIQTTVQLTSSSGGYTYPKPSNSSVNSQSGYNYEKPSVQLSLPTTQKQTTFTTSPSISITTTVQPTLGNEYAKPTNIQENVVSPGQTGYAYSKPSVDFTYPTKEPPTTARPETIAITVPTSQPPSVTTNQKQTTGYEYPNPTNIQENVANPGQSGYTYAKPSVEFTYPNSQKPQTSLAVTDTTVVPTTQPPNLDSNPTNIQQTVAVANQNGYVYEKPSNSLTLPTSKNPEIYFTTQSELSAVTTPKPTEGYQYPAPSNIDQNVVSQNQEGYDYQKPANGLPNTTNPSSGQTNPTTTLKPLSITTLQLTTVGSDSSENGYYYSKPSNPFPDSVTTLSPPTTQAGGYTTTQITTVGYQYPNPTNIQQTVIAPSQTGYNYDKPQNSFTLPTKKPDANNPLTTTLRPITTNDATTKSTAGYEYPNPTNIQTNIVAPSKEPGYNYPQPSTDFTNPNAAGSTLPEIAATNEPQTKPSSAEPTVVPQASQQTGYNYPKPSIDFTYLQPTSASSTYTRPSNGFQNPKPNAQQPTQFGYHYQNPAYFPKQPSAAQSTAVNQGYQNQKPEYLPPQPVSPPTNTQSQGYYDQKPEYFPSQPAPAPSNTVNQGYNYQNTDYIPPQPPVPSSSTQNQGYYNQKPEYLPPQPAAPPSNTQNQGYYNQKPEYFPPQPVAAPSNTQNQGGYYNQKPEYLPPQPPAAPSYTADQGYSYQNPDTPFSSRRSVRQFGNSNGFRGNARYQRQRNIEIVYT